MSESAVSILTLSYAEQTIEGCIHDMSVEFFPLSEEEGCLSKQGDWLDKIRLHTVPNKFRTK